MNGWSAFSSRWGPGGSFAVLLFPLSLLYGATIVLRNLAFETGLLRRVRVGVPVISIGNLTSGGTGKTPLVEFVVARMLQQGRRPAVVSRGYGRRSSGTLVVTDGKTVLASAEQGGDEPVQMAQKLPGAIIVVSERRVEAATVAVRDLGADVVVMDDGFQHRYLHRDVDIVTVDVRTDIRRMMLLPAGRKREPARALRRADAVVFTRMTPDVSRNVLRESMQPWFHGTTAFARHHLKEIRDSTSGRGIPLEKVRLERLLTFSGIAGKDRLASMVRTLGCTVVHDIQFADHHVFTDEDAQRILSAARHHDATVLLTTEKDHVRLAALPALLERLRGNSPLWHTLVAMQFLEGQNELWRLIDSVAGGGRS